MNRTKIICTLGPAVDDDDKIREMIESGMDCARLNFSHGTHGEHHGRMERLRRVRAELGAATAILVDTKGPEIRLKDFESGAVQLAAGQLFTLDSDETPGNESRVGITYPTLAASLTVGDVILIDDGRIEMKVEKLDEEAVICRVVNGGPVSNHKGINVPDVEIDMPYISRADQEDLIFAAEEKVDFIACSFVRSASDVLAVRRFLREHDGEKIKLISKIENRQGYRNLNEILQVSDGVMIARGDLGVEVPFAQIPSIQKNVIVRCEEEGKLVVTATQMLDSMMSSPRPTRAEVSDVANAIYDGTAAVMLSGETAVGKYPVEAVKTMADVAKFTEITMAKSMMRTMRRNASENRILDCVCLAAGQAADFLNAKAIITVSLTGRTAFHLSNYWPGCPIIGLTYDERGYHQLSLARGVVPVKAEKQDSIEKLLEYAKRKAKETGIVGDGDCVVIVKGSSTATASVVDTVNVCEL